MAGFCGGLLAAALPWPLDPGRLTGVATAAACVAVCGVLPMWMGSGRRHPIWLTVAGGALGLAWAAMAHEAALAARLPGRGAGSTATVLARVVTDPVPIATAPGAPLARRFEARVLSRIAGPGSNPAGRRVRLSWYGAPEVARGDVWRWTAVLRGPWSYANPGGFDYERWLLGAGIHGTGYVREGRLLRRPEPGLVDGWRRTLAGWVDGLGLTHRGILAALLTGQSGGIPPPVWDVLRATGTVHLMVISGLHVSLACALGFALGRTLGRLVPGLPLWVDARTAGCVGGVSTAAAYVLLTGSGVPALRALTMSAAALVLLTMGRTARLDGALLLALTILLAADPLAVHQQGFWLSFAAVGTLYLAVGHRYGEGWLGTLLRAQAAVSLGLLPLLALFTDTLPWTGAPANLVAVPVMSMIVVPLVLLGGLLVAVVPVAAAWMLAAADLAMDGVLRWLDWLAQAPLPVVAGGGLALGAAQWAALCYPGSPPRRLLPAAVLAWSLPLCTAPSLPAAGEFRVIAMDVGQGTAVAVDSRRHRLLFDSGPAFPSGFDTGRAVVVPTLAATGPARVDALILSHDDVDHVGGSAYVRTRLSPERVYAWSGGDGRKRCHGRHWRWDGVSFRLLAVARPDRPSDNDRSCILLVTNPRHGVLIAGDVSTRVEADLLRKLAVIDEPVTVMFAPHHGSATSSSSALVRVARPRLVLVSAGRDNRFGHPHPRVVRRYRRVGAQVHQTGREGALVWRSARPRELVRWRGAWAPYWRGRAVTVPSSR